MLYGSFTRILMGNAGSSSSALPQNGRCPVFRVWPKLEKQQFTGKKSRQGGPILFDVRNVAGLSLPTNPALDEIAFELKPLGVLGMNVAAIVLGQFVNYNTYPAHMMTNYFIHNLGMRSHVNSLIRSHRNTWVISTDDEFVSPQWPDEQCHYTAAIWCSFPEAKIFCLRIELATSSREIDLEHAWQTMQPMLEDVFAEAPHWRLVRNRPVLTGLQWAFLVLSARGVKYEVQHDVLSCTKSSLKRARESVLGLYGNRLSTAIISAGFDGHIQPWHLDTNHVRFINDA